MLHIICGGIGSGKTTFARRSFDCYTDYDEVGTKTKQIKNTLSLLRQGKEVAHITTFPSQYEIENLLMKVNQDSIRYYWIDVSQEQCMENILIRNRERDMKRLFEIEQSNREIYRKKQSTFINWIEIKYTPS